VDIDALLGLVSKLLDRYGPVKTFGIATMLILLFALYEVGKLTTSKLLKGKLRFFKAKPQIILTSHSVFTKLDSMIQHQIPSLYLNCPLRARIFKKMLTVRTSVLKDGLMDMAKKEWKVPVDDIKIAWDAFFAKIDYDWTVAARNAGIPLVAVQRFKAFKENVNKVVIDLVTNLCLVGSIYETQQERIAVIFEVLGSMEVSSLFSAGKALDSLNGEISNLTFDGVKCLGCNTNCQYKTGKHD